MDQKVDDEFLPSMVTHHLAQREQESTDDFTSSTIAAHRLSLHLDHQDDLGDDDQEEENTKLVSEVTDITNMIEELSKKANEHIENITEAEQSQDPPNSFIVDDTNSKLVDMNANEKSIIVEKEESPVSEDEEDSDGDDSGDDNVIVYSCTLGDNLPVIIQTLGKEAIEMEDDNEEDDFICEPVESKLVISTDGKISEMSKKTIGDKINPEEENLKNKNLINAEGITENLVDEVQNEKEEKEANIDNQPTKQEDLKEKPKKRKLKDLLFGCFRCTKSQDN